MYVFRQMFIELSGAGAHERNLCTYVFVFQPDTQHTCSLHLWFERGRMLLPAAATHMIRRKPCLCAHVQ